MQILKGIVMDGKTIINVVSLADELMMRTNSEVSLGWRARNKMSKLAFIPIPPNGKRTKKRGKTRRDGCEMLSSSKMSNHR
jgi:hypothetical protein